MLSIKKKFKELFNNSIKSGSYRLQYQEGYTYIILLVEDSNNRCQRKLDGNTEPVVVANLGKSISI